MQYVHKLSLPTAEGTLLFVYMLRQKAAPFRNSFCVISENKPVTLGSGNADNILSRDGQNRDKSQWCINKNNNKMPLTALQFFLSHCPY